MKNLLNLVSKVQAFRSKGTVLLSCVLLCSPSIAQRNVHSTRDENKAVDHLIEQSLRVNFGLRVNALGISSGYPTSPEIGPRLCVAIEPKEDFVYGFYGVVKSQVIHRLSELRGKVSITSPEAALSFVRLPTSPIIYFLLNRREEPGYKELEVVCRETDIPKIAFGLHQIDLLYPTLDKALTYPEGKYALISAATAQQLGIDFARVEPAGTGYTVERTLLVTTFTDNAPEHKAIVAGKFDPGDEWKLVYQRNTRQDLIRTVEWVGADGEYRIEKNEKISVPNTPVVQWRFPKWIPSR